MVPCGHVRKFGGLDTAKYIIALPQETMKNRAEKRVVGMLELPREVRTLRRPKRHTVARNFRIGIEHISALRTNQHPVTRDYQVNVDHSATTLVDNPTDQWSSDFSQEFGVKSA